MLVGIQQVLLHLRVSESYTSSCSMSPDECGGSTCVASTSSTGLHKFRRPCSFFNPLTISIHDAALPKKVAKLLETAFLKTAAAPWFLAGTPSGFPSLFDWYLSRTLVAALFKLTSSWKRRFPGRRLGSKWVNCTSLSISGCSREGEPKRPSGRFYVSMPGGLDNTKKSREDRIPVVRKAFMTKSWLVAPVGSILLAVFI